MAVTYGFYNALNHDRVYDALQMSSIFDGIIRDGVFSTIGESLICKASGTGLIVNVGSGRAWFNHTWTLNDTDYPVEAEESEVVLDRIDAIVLEVNQAVEVRANSIKFVKGTPSSTPVRPTMIHNAEVNQYALAYVNVRAGQTTIFDSDITNVVGTDETPFVTGLMQQLSVEQLLFQWNDDFYRYFNNFKTVSTADFNTFMTTKQTEYAAWYANMQAEGAADLAEFDAWFQHMKDQLDSDAAGHLQAEIDALAEQAEKGSIIRVTTSESTLVNQTCTITQDLLSRTAIFDSHGVADFPSVPMIGDMVITSTDGTMTAISDINIPYFGRYEFEIAFWSATLAIHTSSSDLYGRPITIKQGTTTIGTTAFNQQGVASFDVHSAGTYTVSAVTTGGTESTVDVVVTEQTTYNVELATTPEGATVTPTDVISTWIACAGLENTHNYTTLAEVMADTELFDTLLRDSNACDYMARSTTWAADITSDRDAMTRIGLYDYCCYVLRNNSTWNSAINQSTYSSYIPSNPTGSTTQIHSCPNDTIYHMANGSPVVLTTTDANGVGEIDWGELPEGDLVLYSSVAKDPDNLSNDYHKVCTITKTVYGHTMDFYLMPDPVKELLYWYGIQTDHLDYVYSSSADSVTYNTNYIQISAGYTDSSRYTWAGLSWDRIITADDTKIKAHITDLSDYGTSYMGSMSNRKTYILIAGGEYAPRANEFTFTNTSIGKYPAIQRGGGYEKIHAVWLE